jgi:RNA chaperone Hfq
MNKNLNLQDVILNQIRKDKIASTFILMNGYQFKGVVKGFDSYVVVLDCEGCVIGAGSVVTRDIPANSLAVGVPCRVIREITEEDALENHPELF